jgi:RNA-binding protein 26
VFPSLSSFLIYLRTTECATFIDTLFTVLRTKSYLPYSAPSPPSFAPKNLETDTGIPIPLDGLLSPSTGPLGDGARKRSIETEERDGPPAKGPRLSTEGQFSRYGNHQNGRGEHRSTGGWGTNGYGESMEMHGAEPGVGGGRGMGMNGRRQSTYQPPEQSRGICRDYYSAFVFRYLSHLN